MEPMHELVRAWKHRALRPADLPLEAAWKSIGTGPPQFEAKRTGPSEWTFCLFGSNQAAVFSYAAIFQSADPIETGNLVRTDTELPAGLPRDRAEREAGFKCNYSYSFDTTRDIGLFNAQAHFDEYIEGVPGFNARYSLPRRTWQDGTNLEAMRRFWMRVPMFLRVRYGEQKGDPPAHLHEWVKEAHRQSNGWRANPARPVVLELEAGRLKNIADCDPPNLTRGDAVAISFTVSYIEGARDWYPNFTLVEVIRVGSLNRSRSGNAGPAAVDIVTLAEPARPVLGAGEVLLEMLHSDEPSVALAAESGRGPPALVSTDEGPPPSSSKRSLSVVVGQHGNATLHRVGDVAGSNLPTTQLDTSMVVDKVEEPSGSSDPSIPIADHLPRGTVRARSASAYSEDGRSFSSISSLTDRSVSPVSAAVVHSSSIPEEPVRLGGIQSAGGSAKGKEVRRRTSRGRKKARR